MLVSTAPVPQTAFASVNQSAKWKSRIIEKRFGTRAGRDRGSRGARYTGRSGNANTGPGRHRGGTATQLAGCEPLSLIQKEAENEMGKTLEGKRIAFLATDGVEQSELEQPWQAMQKAGANVELLSVHTGAIQAVRHMDKGDTFEVDGLVCEADAADYDGLVFPGGVANPDTLRANDKAVRFVRQFFEQSKPVAAICHGPWTLVEADVVRGRTVTSWPSLKTDVKNAGGQWVDEEVHVDQGLVTSRKPDDLPAFCAKAIEEFAEGPHARRHQAGATQAPAAGCGNRRASTRPRQHLRCPRREALLELRERVGLAYLQVGLLAEIDGEIVEMLRVAFLHVFPAADARSRARARAPEQRAVVRARARRAARAASSRRRAATAPSAGAPAAARIVAVQSIVIAACSVTAPAGTTPGQRTIAGTRMPPSYEIQLLERERPIERVALAAVVAREDHERVALEAARRRSAASTRPMPASMLRIICAYAPSEPPFVIGPAP